MSHLIRLSDYRNRSRRSNSKVFFNKPELSQLLGLYSEHVARGDYRDYAIDHLDEAAMFSMFRHAHESPLLTVVKTTDGKRRRTSFLLFQGEKRLLKTQSLGEILHHVRSRPRLVRE
ncbi:MAG: DUF2794 domain-containing protein [Pseudomonadota bacterium]